MPVRYSVLGPLLVEDDAGPVGLAAHLERLLLATLLIHDGRVVPVDSLVDALWGDEPPRSAGKTLQTYVSHLRRIVGRRLETVAPGYRLVVADGELDAAAASRLISEGRHALIRRESATAARQLGAALSLWRGDAYADLRDHPVLTADAARLDELRTTATIDWLDARLGAGAEQGLSIELEAFLAAHPLNERGWALLMRALYREGRQADALEAFQRARRLLVDELGIEPGPELRATETAVLTQDPSLDGHTEDLPSTRYALAPDGIEIAYSTRGEGERDVVFCFDWAFNLELMWEIDEFQPLIDGLGSVGRLIAIQRRDTGESGRSQECVLTPPEACVADFDAVLDAVGAGVVDMVGWGHGGQLGVAYAAARPDRVRSMAAITGYARLAEAPDHPEGLSWAFLDGFLDVIAQMWGSDQPVTPIFGPERGVDPAFIARVARINRLTATPAQAAAMQRAAYEFDVRSLVPSVACPTLVVGLTSSITGVDNSRAFAASLPDGRFIELPGWFVPTPSEMAGIADAVVAFIADH